MCALDEMINDSVEEFLGSEEMKTVTIRLALVLCTGVDTRAFILVGPLL